MYRTRQRLPLKTLGSRQPQISEAATAEGCCKHLWKVYGKGGGVTRGKVEGKWGWKKIIHDEWGDDAVLVDKGVVEKWLKLDCHGHLNC